MAACDGKIEVHTTAVKPDFHHIRSENAADMIIFATFSAKSPEFLLLFFLVFAPALCYISQVAKNER